MTTTNDSQLATIQSGSIQSLTEMDDVSKKLAASGLMGKNTTPEMVFGLMLLCQCEGLNPIAAMKRYHIVEGRPSMRADAMQAEFLAHGGAIIFHVRTDEMVAATLFSDKARLDEAARKRASGRFEAMWALDCEIDDQKRAKLMVKVSEFSMDGEETIIRTFADCQQKGITNGRDGIKANWKSSPRQMLTARVITEGVRLVNPGLIAGIYNEDETADIVRQEREALAKMIDKPTEADVDSIMGIIAGYDEELKQDIADGRRKNLLGLRSDLVCKLGDLGLKMTTPPEGPAPTVNGQPATAVTPVEVLPPEEKTTKTTRTRKAAAPAETQQEPARIEQGMDTPWREFICLRGPAGGMMNGNALEKIFVTGHMAPNSPQKLDRLMAWFPQESIPTSSDPHDKVLWAKVQEADKELRAKFATGSPATPASTQTTPAPTKPAQQAASPTDWREFVIPGKNPTFSGHKMGEFENRILEVKKYADSIDDENISIMQKSFKGRVGLAMAELHPSAQPAELPLAANGGIAPHTKQILDIMTVKKWNPAFFVMQCKINGWLPEEARKIEDITTEDFASLEAEWATVEAEVDKAHQPEQRV